jgi:uncharacterized membrane protein
MQRSVFLVKLIGPPFLAIALGLFLDQNTYWGMIDEVIRHPPIGNMLIYLSGLLSPLGGLAIVNAHPSWTRDWRVIITIIGWLMLIGGIVRIVLPDIGLRVGSALYASPTTLPIVAIISLGLGGFLSFKGYWTET